MPMLKLQLQYKHAKITHRAVGINLERLDIQNDEAEADIEASRIYYLTAHFVAREEKTDFTVKMVPPNGFHVRFPGYPKDATPIVTWTAHKPLRDYFRDRRFYLEPVS